MDYFFVGDIVRVRLDVKDEDLYANVHPGDIGTVVVVGGPLDGIGVDWGHYVNGHDCDGGIPDGNGTFVVASCLELLPGSDDEMDIPSQGLEGVL